MEPAKYEAVAAPVTIPGPRPGAAGASALEPTDSDLLRLFVKRRDQQAFRAILRRHGPMVLGVCRRVLHGREDAEDAFQATFLVLSMRAASVTKPEFLASWLYGVATQTALKARRAEGRRRERERRLVDMLRRNPNAPVPEMDLRGVLDEEIGRLAEKYRSVVVLCYLQGKTKREAARQLGWPEGTVATRLGYAREVLRRRLKARGLAVTLGALMTALSREMAPAAVPSPLIAKTAEAASLLASGNAAAGAVSATVVQLAKGVSTAMFVAKVKLVVLLVLGVLAVTAGAAEVARREIARAEANGILEKSIAAQAALTSYATHLHTTVEFLQRPADSGAKVDKEIHSFEVRVDGDRQDVAHEDWHVRRGKAEPEPHYKSRTIWDGKRNLHRQQYQRGRGQVQPSVSTRRQDFRTSYTSAPFLYGMAAGDQQPMAQILRDAGSARLRERTEDVAGHSCHVIEGETARGSYVLWIDPAAAYLVRRASVVKGPGDLWFDRKLHSQATGTLQTRTESTINEVRIEKIDSRWVTVGAVSETKDYYAGGIEHVRTTAKRSKFQLDPDFRKLGAFVMDGIAEGQRVAVMGEDGAQAGWAVWRNGDVTPVAPAAVRARAAKAPAVGEPAPATEGRDVDGKPIKLSDYRGKVVLVAFWGPWCGPCMARVPAERALVKALEGKPFALVGVANDTKPGPVKAAVQRELMTWPNLFDGDNGPIHQAWGVRSWPTHFVLDANGVIRYRDPDNVDDAVLMLLEEQEKK